MPSHVRLPVSRFRLCPTPCFARPRRLVLRALAHAHPRACFMFILPTPTRVLVPGPSCVAFSWSSCIACHVVMLAVCARPYSALLSPPPPSGIALRPPAPARAVLPAFPSQCSPVHLLQVHHVLLSSRSLFTACRVPCPLLPSGTALRPAAPACAVLPCASRPEPSRVLVPCPSCVELILVPLLCGYVVVLVVSARLVFAVNLTLLAHHRYCCFFCNGS